MASSYNSVIKRITLGFNKINEYLATIHSVDNPLMPESSDLKAKVEWLDHLNKSLVSIQAEMDNVLETDLDRTLEYSLQERYFKLKCALSEQLAIFEDTTEQAPVTISNRGQLPKIPLPLFDGNYISWPNFRDKFNTLIIEDRLLPDIQKFHYLNGCLNNDCLKMIENIPISQNNFKLAWQIICDRFDDSRLIIKGHIKNLLSLPSIPYKDSRAIRSLANNIQSNYTALITLDSRADIAQLFIENLVLSKLDHQLILNWESLHKDEPLSPLKELMKFLNARASALENQEIYKNDFISKKPFSQKKFINHNAHARVKPLHNNNYVYTLSKSKSSSPACCLCSQSHYLYACSKFRRLAPRERKEVCVANGICLNCLRANSPHHICSKQSCKICHLRHSTFLHEYQGTNQHSSKHSPIESSPAVSGKELKLSHNMFATSAATVLSSQGNSELNSKVCLPVATIFLHNSKDRLILARALLDTGSQLNLISQELFNNLQLESSQSITHISAINNLGFTSQGKCNVKMSSCFEPFETSLDCNIVPHIIPYLENKINMSQVNIPKEICLADNIAHTPRNIDVLLGAQVCAKIMQSTCVQWTDGHLTVLKTSLGNIVLGGQSVVENISSGSPVCGMTLNQTLKKFWEVENVNLISEDSEEKQFSENHYQINTIRLSNGSYQVSLPFKTSPEYLGNSYTHAMKCFLSLEKRFLKEPALYKCYVDTMNSYLSNGELDLVEKLDLKSKHYFLPHFSVKCPGNDKFRIVFNASAKTSTGISLNNILAKGPTIQPELFDILINFRLHKFCMMSDIKQMFRRIKVHQSDRKYQTIIWRENSNQDFAYYQINTVVFGIRSSPYLATRTLNQIAEDIKTSEPLLARIISNNFYIDDFLCSLQKETDLTDIYHKLTTVLKEANFSLRKWATNSDSLSKLIPCSLKASEDVEFPSEGTVKTLGLNWNTKSDQFQVVNHYKNNLKALSSLHFTKKRILSLIAGIFDPLGIMEPAKIKYKIFMQTLWKSTVSWNEPLNADLNSTWLELFRDFTNMSQISFPRQVLLPEATSIKLFGFCDASLVAMGANLYLLSSNGKETHSHLLCAKSKIAPLKPPLTLPRLELCAMHLLAKLLHKIMNIIDIKIDAIHLFSDSAINLYRLRQPLVKFNIFVANRLKEIHLFTDNITSWHHIVSKENPADLLTRGISWLALADHKFWFHGPSWLVLTQDSWPTAFPQTEFTPLSLEFRICSTMVSKPDPWFQTYITRFSNLNRLVRATAYCFRFVSNCRLLKQNQSVVKDPLTADEVSRAHFSLIRLVQRMSFANEIKCLEQHKPISADSQILSLFPFLDGNGLLRVGGRLSNSDLPYEGKHGLILPYTHHFTILLIRREHKATLHSQGQALMFHLRQNYWIPSLKRLIKKETHRCVVCFRLKSETARQLMGTLPAFRVNVSRPFQTTFVDYAGPFHIKTSLVRCNSTMKCYLAVFTCLSTKLTHLEIVTSLKASDFVMTLIRFIARRGTPKLILSDNAGCFKGSDRYLRDFFLFLKEKYVWEEISGFLSMQNISWKFSVPASPHRNALVEAVIKQMKYHLRRQMGTCLLSYIEFETLIMQIEQCLNSRPLIAVTSDVCDINYLTPNHLATGFSLKSLPSEPDYVHDVDFTTRYQKIGKLLTIIWNKWKNDYLNQLQQRVKWKVPSPPLKENQVVLLKNNSTPLMWPLGRVTEVYSGPDGLIRSVKVKTVQGNFNRAIQYVCPLPEQSPSDS